MISLLTLCTPGNQVINRARPIIRRSKSKSVKYECNILEPCFVNQKKEPSLRMTKTSVVDKAAQLSVLKLGLVWVACRLSKTEAQMLPAYSGWISITGSKGKESISTVEYLPPIMHPFTENNTVKKTMDYGKYISACVNQPYVLIFYDLAGAKKAYVIQWNYPEQYINLIVMLGDFHLMCAAYHAVGKIMTGSGFEDIVVNSGICASGSMNGVMSGKLPFI